MQRVDTEGAPLCNDSQSVGAVIVLGVGRPADFDITSLTDASLVVAPSDATEKVVGLANDPVVVFHHLFCAAISLGPQLRRILGKLVTLERALLWNFGQHELCTKCKDEHRQKAVLLADWGG